MSDQHNEIQQLLGAYVLHAVDPIEHRRIERHIASCEECAREVALLQVPAAELALLPDPEDAHELVDRIASSLPWRPRKLVTRLSAAVAAIAIGVAGFLGVRLAGERSEQGRITEVIAAADRIERFTGSAGFAAKGHLYLADGQAVLALDDVPALRGGRVYQLWALDGARPSSMAIVDGDGRLVLLFEWRGDAEAFAVTVEPAGGSAGPTSDPVLSTA
jgi:anti-sigma-K factor RskA